MMNGMIKRNDLWAPLWGLSNLHQGIDSLFHDFMQPWDARGEMAAPACDIEETDDRYLAKLDMPGMNKEDIHVEIRDNQLLVTGERKEERSEKQGTRYFAERTHGCFSRCFTIPGSVNSDKIDASYKDGVLRLEIPKKEGAKPRRIEIKEGLGNAVKKLLGKKKEDDKSKAA